jgi:hypothetical protein
MDLRFMQSPQNRPTGIKRFEGDKPGSGGDYTGLIPVGQRRLVLTKEPDSERTATQEGQPTWAKPPCLLPAARAIIISYIKPSMDFLTTAKGTGGIRENRE